MNSIKLKYYLNTKLKPIIEDGIEKFSVYFRYNFNGKNHRIPSFFIQNYLCKDTDLDEYILERRDEEFFINLFYSKNKSYTPKFYIFDIQTIAFPIKDIFIDYLYNSFEDIYPKNDYLKNYEKELISYISKKAELSNLFLKDFFKTSTYNNFNYYPTSFLKESETKFVLNTYNLVIKFSTERYIHTYDWIERGLGESFKKMHGEKHFEIVDNLVSNYVKVSRK